MLNLIYTVNPVHALSIVNLVSHLGDGRSQIEVELQVYRCSRLPPCAVKVDGGASEEWFEYPLFENLEALQTL